MPFTSLAILRATRRCDIVASRGLAPVGTVPDSVENAAALSGQVTPGRRSLDQHAVDLVVLAGVLDDLDADVVTDLG